MNEKKIFSFLAKFETPLIVFVGLAILLCNYLVFMYVPNEKVMGAVQRVFYFHVASATACYISFAVVFAASIFYLVKRKNIFDVINVAAAEVGFLFCTIVLVSGMIWGKAAWNTWFRFEPRLVSFLLLWLIFLAFVLLRSFADGKKLASHTAVLGIVGAVTVPLMIYSIKLLPSFQQLHPQVLEKQGLDPVMLQALLICIACFVVFQFLLMYFRIKIGLLRSHYECT